MLLMHAVSVSPALSLPTYGTRSMNKQKEEMQLFVYYLDYISILTLFSKISLLYLLYSCNSDCFRRKSLQNSNLIFIEQIKRCQEKKKSKGIPLTQIDLVHINNRLHCHSCLSQLNSQVFPSDRRCVLRSSTGERLLLPALSRTCSDMEKRKQVYKSAEDKKQPNFRKKLHAVEMYRDSGQRG